MILLLTAAVQMASPPTPPEPQQHRIVVVHKVGPDGKVTEQRLEGDEATKVAEAGQECDPARTFSSEVDRTVDGKRQVSRIRVCAKGAESPAQWQQALRNSMERVRADRNLPADVRTRVLAELQAALDKARQ